MANSRQQMLPLSSRTPTSPSNPRRPKAGRVEVYGGRPTSWVPTGSGAGRIGSRHVLNGGRAAVTGRVDRAVRWGAAVVERVRPSVGKVQTSAWVQVARGGPEPVRAGDARPRAAVAGQPSKPRAAAPARQVRTRTAPAATGAPLATRIAAPEALRAQDPMIAATTATSGTPGDRFARNRIRHAFELFGACMLIATFLAMAMFA